MEAQAVSHPFEEFRARREAGNARVLGTHHLGTKRFFALDKEIYKDGALPAVTKELLGLATSLVLRCNDCVDYHLERCVELGCTREQLDEAMGVAMMVGGSIVIPHARHAAHSIDYLLQQRDGVQGSSA